jgi:hypothetical protein
VWHCTVQQDLLQELLHRPGPAEARRACSCTTMSLAMALTMCALWVIWSSNARSPSGMSRDASSMALDATASACSAWRRESDLLACLAPLDVHACQHVIFG